MAAGAQAASPAWKLLAVTGPTNLPTKQSEVQRVTVEAEGGSFTLSQETAKGEGTLSYALDLGSFTEGSNTVEVIGVGSGTFEPGQLVTAEVVPAGTTIVSVAGSTLTLSNNATSSSFGLITAAGKQITGVTTSSGAFHVGDQIAGEGIPVGATVAAVGAGTLTLSAFPTSGGTVGLTGSEVTGPIPYSATATQVQAALAALPALVGTSVSGGPGGDADHPWFITFGGANEYANVAPLVADDTSLVGPHANVQVVTSVPGGPGTGEVQIVPTNIGGAASSGTVTLRFGPLPDGIVTSGPATGEGLLEPEEVAGPDWNCPGGAGASIVVCTSTNPVRPLAPANAIHVPVEVEPGVPFSAAVPLAISGGNGGVATYQMPIVVSNQPASPGVQALWAGSFDADGKSSVQAGGHPFSAATSFQLNTVRSRSGRIVPAGDSREVVVDLPPGFTGNPLATSRCPQSSVVPPAGAIGLETPACNKSAAVGNFAPNVQGFDRNPRQFLARIYNDVPTNGYAAEFSTRVSNPVQSLLASVRSVDDYGVRITAPNNPNFYKIYGSFAALEGEPAAANGRAFLTNPADCAEEARQTPFVTINSRTYQEPGIFAGSSFTLPAVTGCDKLKFSPGFSFVPTNTGAASGTGATAYLHLPQDGLSDPAQLATPALKRAVVTLPEGLTLNPSAANGLAACSEQQIGLRGTNFPLPNPIRFNEESPSCPDASKLGTLQVMTPLLDEPLVGTIYLAAQDENPFHSLIALYLVIDDEKTGISVKLPGEVVPDQSTGRLTATFDYNPQLPFEDLVLHFRGGGPRSQLATPEVCGSYKSTGALTPWSAPESGPPAQIEEPGFSVTGACASSPGSRPFAPSFEAGTVDPVAGAYSPMVIKVARKDGEQELRHLDFTLPPGLTGRLAGIPYCPESAIAAAGGRTGKQELASSSCPGASQLGTVDTAAGVGSEPIHVGGNVYLAGPYKGAPISAVVITPAVAGPFDLGNVVVRTPLYVDLETAQITAKSDPIPTILRGVPLKVRSVAIQVNRATFSLNPTNCDPMQVTTAIRSSDGNTAKPANRFQVGACNKLKFKPKLKLRLRGATKRSGHPALKAVVTYPKKGAYANIARAQVGLPHSEFLDQGNLDKVCKQAELRSGTCPKRSIYGHAKAWTPLLDKPLEGPVYLGVGFGYKLPALVADLDGQVRILLKGKVDTTKHEGIRNTFEAVPDAPVSRFVLEMKGGKKYGLLENSENICRKAQRASARFVGQNGNVSQLRPKIGNDCGKKKKSKKHTKRNGHR